MRCRVLLIQELGRFCKLDEGFFLKKLLGAPGLTSSSILATVASLLLVAMPFATSSILLLLGTRCQVTFGKTFGLCVAQICKDPQSRHVTFVHSDTESTTVRKTLFSEAIASRNKRTLIGAPCIATRSKDASRNKCIASSNKCLTSSNKKLLGTSASLLVTSALLVVTKSY